MKTSEFDYELPEELIAQEPLPERSHSRMMVVHRALGRIEHKRITDLPQYLSAGDLLVLNDTRVIPARLFGRRAETGGKVEVLLVEEAAGADNVWSCMFKSGRPPRPGMQVLLANDRIRGEIVSVDGGGHVHIAMESAELFMDIVDEEGVPPVPPYIRRGAESEKLVAMDRSRYQTVYARDGGAVAAPTAGLHFSDSLFEELAAAGVERSFVTLHVGPGTFKPVKSDRVEDHVMEEERYVLSPETAAVIKKARAAGKKVVGVGSTSVRTLETVFAERGKVEAATGRSSLFIYPPCEFCVIDAMLTNFHLPKSTLLMMIIALAGRDLILQAYREAVQERYRFYSYGDCMLIL